MSGEFKFIRAFFGTFKDKDLEGELLLARDNLLQEAISSFATLPE